MMKTNKKNKNIFCILGFLLFILFFLLAKNFLSDVFFYLGEKNFNSQNYQIQKAERFYLLSLFLDHAQPLANYQLSRIHLTEGQYELAYKEISREIDLYPGNFRAYYVRGLVGGYLEKFDQAEKDFRFFIANQQNNPRRWAGYVDLSWVLIRSGQFDQAVGLLDNIDEEFKENPWVLANQGLAYYKKGDYETARSILEKAAQEAEKITEEDWLQAYPGNDPSTAKRGPDEIKAAISYNLLLVYDKLGDHEKIFNEYEKYLSLIPMGDPRRTKIIDQLQL